jgi:hypothetical protein
MAIYFSNGMSIDTSNDFRIIGSDGSTVEAQILSSTGVLEKSDPVWRQVYLTGGGQQVVAAGKITAVADYGGEGNHYNFSTAEFICPVPGTYRMSIYSLQTGAAYANSGLHAYGYHNGTFISNGIHLVGNATTNYLSVGWLGLVRAAAGDYLWFASGGGRLYSDGWTVMSYHLVG